MKPVIVSIDDLPPSTQSDILYEISEYFCFDREDVRNNLMNLVPSTEVVLWYPNPKTMLRQFQPGRRASKTNVDKLLRILEEQEVLDPILTVNGKFLDGGHRTKAYIKYGAKFMPAVDIGHLMSMNWEAWMNNELSAQAVNDEAANIAKRLA